MPVYTILPVDPAEAEIRLRTLDTEDVLKAVQSLKCHEADVLADGTYAFSVLTDASGSRAIFQRESGKGATFGEMG